MSEYKFKSKQEKNTTRDTQEKKSVVHIKKIAVRRRKIERKPRVESQEYQYTDVGAGVSVCACETPLSNNPMIYIQMSFKHFRSNNLVTVCVCACVALDSIEKHTVPKNTARRCDNENEYVVHRFCFFLLVEFGSVFRFDISFVLSFTFRSIFQC